MANDSDLGFVCKKKRFFYMASSVPGNGKPCEKVHRGAGPVAVPRVLEVVGLNITKYNDATERGLERPKLLTEVICGQSNVVGAD